MGIREEQRGEVAGDSAHPEGAGCVETSCLRLVQLELRELPKLGSVLEGPDSVAALLRDCIGRRDRECFVVLHLDARLRPTSMEMVSVGTLHQSLVHPREVFKSALLANAYGIIAAHNHPSGDVMPSEADKAIRERLAQAGELLGVSLVDFMIVGPAEDYYSFVTRSST